MSECIKYFDNLDEAEGYEIREVPFSGYIKDPHSALFSKRWGDIKEGKVSYNRYLFYTTDSNTAVTPYHYNFGADFGESIYPNGQGIMIFDSDVTRIGSRAFFECSSLTSITIPNSVESIGDEAFGECSSLSSIDIPNSVTDIANVVFRNCTSLTSIIIPSNVRSLGGSIFSGCSSLKKIICKPILPPLLSINTDFPDGVIIYVPKESVEAYTTAPNWRDHTSKIKPIE